jgi:hypothetical protein
MEQTIKKYIVTSGCSFTRQARRVGITGNEYDFMQDPKGLWKWPNFIQKLYPDYKVVTYGNPTNDNDIIAKTILYGVDKLLKSGVSPKDIKVIVQWSGWSRNNFFISKQKQIKNDYFLNKNFIKERDKDTYPINEDFAHVNDFLDIEKEYIGEHGYFMLSGGYHNDHVKIKPIDFFETYVDKVFSAEERMIAYFQSILLVQSFCKANDIDYLCFTMHNNFSEDYTNDDRFPLWKPENSNKTQAWHIVYEKYIPITWEADIKNQFENKPYSKWLYDMIDFDNFWFYKEEGVTKFGGQVEWSIKNYNHDEVSNKELQPNILWLECAQLYNGGKTTKEDLVKFLDDTVYWQHTSPYLNEKFVKEELSYFLGKSNEKLI